jgi:hypothetical protein
MLSQSGVTSDCALRHMQRLPVCGSIIVAISPHHECYPALERWWCKEQISAPPLSLVRNLFLLTQVRSIPIPIADRFAGKVILGRLGYSVPGRGVGIRAVHTLDSLPSDSESCSSPESVACTSPLSFGSLFLFFKIKRPSSEASHTRRPSCV